MDGIAAIDDHELVRGLNSAQGEFVRCIPPHTNTFPSGSKTALPRLRRSPSGNGVDAPQFVAGDSEVASTISYELLFEESEPPNTKIRTRGADYANAPIGGNHRNESALGLSTVPVWDNRFAPRPTAVTRNGQIHVVGMHSRPAPRQPIRRKRAVRQSQDGGVKPVLALCDSTRCRPATAPGSHSKL